LNRKKNKRFLFERKKTYSEKSNLNDNGCEGETSGTQKNGDNKPDG
jgi:hypothetical protein